MIKEPIPSSPDSPCIRNCCLDEQDVCMGCWRTLDEILAWGNTTEEQRVAILQNTHTRKESAPFKNHY